ncbi:MAG: T9SS type A sorting domain-containing protein [Bacteroidales bacterium]|nr:T9SS type A sorting domain-containing protein [Bacteroidales bacterium]
MKSKKLLIGLIVAAFAGGAGFVSAQPKANYQNNLIEIGPDNVAGRVRAIVVDNADPEHTTLYAGGVAGGLYKMVGHEAWQLIPYVSNNRQVTLPISTMIQLPDNNLLIGTGEGIVENHGINHDRMSPKGRGLYHYNATNNSFTLLQATDPNSHPEFSYINRLACYNRNNHWYIYAATNDGLYRWNLNASNPDWTAAPQLVQAGNFQDVIIITADNLAYATTPNSVYRIGNVTGESAAVNITTSNSAFATATRIELAAASVNGTTRLYAVVADSNGLLDGVFLTTNQQTWSRLTTPTMVPFDSKNPGTLNNAIAVNPRNHKEIYVGGATIWNGEGYVENSYYQWIKQSVSETELNYGNYMGTAYSNITGNFVHSGIHQIVPEWTIENGDTIWVCYYATDGGVYKGYHSQVGGMDVWSYNSLNKGLNTVQFNHVAVCPDGSVIGGAIDNSSLFIQSRNNHDGSAPINSWYDNDENSVMNHMANVVFNGNGGGVSSSMFQMVKPYTRRSIFVSAEPGYFYYIGRDGMTTVGSFGRACTDYADYTNTQTWTAGPEFISDQILGSNPIPNVRIWETTNNTIWNDSISFTIDTTHTIIRNGEAMAITNNTTIQPGDKYLVTSRANYYYPFYHTFTNSFVVKNQPTHTIINSVVSRMLVCAQNALGGGAVYLNTTPNDYSKVWSLAESGSLVPSVQQKLMHWAKLFSVRVGYSIFDANFSLDGKSVYAAVTNDTTGESYIIRVYDYTNANVNDPVDMKRKLGYNEQFPVYDGMPRITSIDTIFAANGANFTRPISSIVVDPRQGQDNIIITFGGYGSNEPNMVYIKNASTPASRTITNISVSNATNGMSVSDPVYSALIECTTGAIYVGTEKGVFVSTSNINPVWNVFGEFDGVPVTSIVQQTKALPREKYVVREGVEDVTYLYAKTKYPYAIYFGTYGRGVFLDTSYVTDHENEIVGEEDWLGITNVTKGENSVKIYPNPAIDKATVDIAVVNAGNAVVKIYDLGGKLVHSEQLGYLTEGSHQYSINCSKFNHGMYLVNINIGKESATSKLIVR